VIRWLASGLHQSRKEVQQDHGLSRSENLGGDFQQHTSATGQVAA